MLSRLQSQFDEAYQGFDFPSGSTIIAAVSGGGDSLAMLVSLRDYLAGARPDLELLAATVDHGLRARSADEVSSVKALCASFGIHHVTRRWNPGNLQTGIAAAARTARYRLLCELADESGATMIVTGHTADDQAETIAMRLRRGAGRGLAGMAPATLLDSRFWLLRPLLGQRRETLRSFLLERRIGWIDDPTNDDTRFERPRIRHELSSRPDIGELLKLGRQAASQREQLGRNAAHIIDQFVSRPAAGLFRIASDALMQPDQDALVYATRILLAVAGGALHLPDEGKTRSLLQALGDTAQPARMTLSRSVIDRRKTAIFVYRENRDLPDWAAIADNLDWDGRYRIEGAGDEDGVLLGPFGRKLTGPPAMPSVPQSILRAAQSAEPAILFPGGQPQLLDSKRLGRLASPVAAPWSQLLPSFDLAPARAIGALIGAAIAPDSPYRGHSEGQA